eukprot:Anaeramoba_ignava/a224538_15.p1 GENE.a224538_15~~a224538_15.p1  ORF type:complete len:355 (+),score=127.05 a224538_15:21-1085(+)
MLSLFFKNTSYNYPSIKLTLQSSVNKIIQSNLTKTETRKITNKSNPQKNIELKIPNFTKKFTTVFKRPSFFVSTNWLKDNIKNSNVIVVDCRGDLMDPKKGKQDYLKGHIPGSIFIDGEKELLGKLGKHGGRHPFPNMNDFKKAIENLGIDYYSHIVSYGFFATRFLFMLQSFGFNNVSILDGGYDEWIKKGNEIDSNIPSRKPVKINGNDEKSDLIVDMKYVSDNLNKIILVDSRDSQRYNGIHEPIDKVAGKIPGSINFFFKNNYDQNGKLKSIDELKMIYKDLLEMIKNGKEKKEIVAFCGSGVTVFDNYFPFLYLGIPVKIYAGGFSDWISYDDNPVITSDNEVHKSKEF